MAESRHLGDIILKVDHISLSFGGIKALIDISFQVRSGNFWPSSAPTARAKAPCLMSSMVSITLKREP